jgi:hypothetical protein
MALSNDLMSQFVKTINADKNEPKVNTTVYGTVKYDGKYYVQLDGSELLTPVQTTTDVKDGERVTVTIENHTATITGNLTSPAARTEDVETIGKHVSEFETIIADKVRTEDLEAINAAIDNLRVKLASIDELDVQDLDVAYADIGDLEAEVAKIEYLDAGTIDALVANIEKIEADFGNFKSISTEDFEALNAEITNLKGYAAEFTYLRAEALTAARADIKDAHIKYATIDFANIDEAAIHKLFGEEGIIKDLTVKDQQLTGQLFAVEINADMIKTGSLTTDRLLVKGPDGLYYRLNMDCFDEEGNPIVNATVEQLQNGLHGENIIAKTVTADKVAVTDLTAFGATIGGFVLSDNSIHSDVKASIDNATRGIYMDKEGQLYIGDGTNFIKYYKTTDEDGNEVYKLDISAESILFGSDAKSSAEDLRQLTEHVHIGTYEDKETGEEQPCVELAEGDTAFKLRLTNTAATFMDGDTPRTEVTKDGLATDNIKVQNEFAHGGFVWAKRSNGNLGISWKGDVN